MFREVKCKDFKIKKLTVKHSGGNISLWGTFFIFTSNQLLESKQPWRTLLASNSAMNPNTSNLFLEMDNAFR